jgi:hypothetical protein
VEQYELSLKTLVMAEEMNPGTPPTEPVVPAATPAPMPAKKDQTAMIALVLAILGLVLLWVPYIAIVIQALGIIEGMRAMKTENKKMAQIATGLSVLGLIASIIVVFLLMPWTIRTAN